MADPITITLRDLLALQSALLSREYTYQAQRVKELIDYIGEDSPQDTCWPLLRVYGPEQVGGSCLVLFLGLLGREDVLRAWARDWGERMMAPTREALERMTERAKREDRQDWFHDPATVDAHPAEVVRRTQAVIDALIQTPSGLQDAIRAVDGYYRKRRIDERMFDAWPNSRDWGRDLQAIVRARAEVRWIGNEALLHGGSEKERFMPIFAAGRSTKDRLPDEARLRQYLSGEVAVSSVQQVA